jgi:coenzyme PQQ precursor peptide PqqA
MTTAVCRPTGALYFSAAPISLVANRTTNSAIQNKIHIESIHSFLAMSDPTRRRNVVAWKTPRIVEIAVGMKINTYSCADM